MTLLQVVHQWDQSSDSVAARDRSPDASVASDHDYGMKSPSPQKEVAPQRPKKEVAPQRPLKEVAPQRPQKEVAPQRPPKEVAPQSNKPGPKVTVVPARSAGLNPSAYMTSEHTGSISADDESSDNETESSSTVWSSLNTIFDEGPRGPSPVHKKQGNQ